MILYGALFVGVVGTIIYVLYLMQTNWDVFISTVTTFVSVYLSAIIAMVVYKAQRNDEGKTQRKILVDLLLSDIKRIPEEVNLAVEQNSLISFGENKIECCATSFSISLYERAIQSGLFNAEKTKALIQVSQEIIRFNQKSQYLLDLMATNAAYSSSTNADLKRRLQLANNQVNKSKDALIERLNDLRQLFK